MRTVQQLLDEKGHDIKSVHPDDSVFDAIQKLANANIGSLIVIEDGQPVEYGQVLFRVDPNG